MLWGIGLCCAACGGHVRSSAPDSHDAVGGGDGVASVGGNDDVTSEPGGSPSLAGSAGALSPSASGADAAAGAAGAVDAASLPSDPGGQAVCLPLPDARCVGQNISLHPPFDNPSVWVEPLQVPAYGLRPAGYYPPSVDSDPATWDRSPLPAGACVYRIHGLSPNCLRAGGLGEGSCEASWLNGSQAEMPSFYETNVCMRHIAPGCPTADPWNAAGHWWYLQPDGENVDLVLCAPECASPAIEDGGGCLRLAGPLPKPTP